jgi:hypothetical protein
MFRPANKTAAVATVIAMFVAVFAAGYATADRQAADADAVSRPDEHMLAIGWIIRNDGGQTGWQLDLNEPSLPLRKQTGFYHAYLEGPKGRVSVGTFNAAGAPGLTLWSGVSPVDYPHFVVVSEPDGRVVASADVHVQRGERHAVVPVEVHG